MELNFSTGAQLNCLNMFEDGVGYTAGNVGQIYKTTDFGENWNPLIPQ